MSGPDGSKFETNWQFALLSRSAEQKSGVLKGEILSEESQCRLNWALQHAPYIGPHRGSLNAVAIKNLLTLSRCELGRNVKEQSLVGTGAR